MKYLEARERARTYSLKDKCCLVYHLMPSESGSGKHEWEPAPIGTYHAMVQGIWRNGELIEEIPVVNLTNEK